MVQLIHRRHGIDRILSHNSAAAATIYRAVSASDPFVCLQRFAADQRGRPLVTCFGIYFHIRNVVSQIIVKNQQVVPYCPLSVNGAPPHGDLTAQHLAVTPLVGATSGKRTAGVCFSQQTQRQSPARANPASGCRIRIRTIQGQMYDIRNGSPYFATNARRSDLAKRSAL